MGARKLMGIIILMTPPILDKTKKPEPDEQ